MAQTIQDILGVESMLGVIQEVSRGIPTGIVDDGFFTVTKTVAGDSGEYTKITGTRKTARQAMYGSASKRRNLTGVSRQKVTLIHVLEHIMHEMATLMMLRQFDNPARQEMGKELIDLQTQEFVQLFINLRRAAVHSVLTLGHIYIDGEGNLLPDDTDALIDVDFSVPADHKDQLGGIIAASWGTAATDILGQLTDIKKKAAEDTGLRITRAYYGRNIPGYIAGNNGAKEILKTNVRLAEALKDSGDFTLKNIRFTDATEAFYQQDDGTDNFWWDDDMVVFTPDVAPTWFQTLQGTYPIATDVGNLFNDGPDAAGSIIEAPGMFQYALQEQDPTGIKHLAGDTFLPVLAVPSAIFIADVTP